MHVPGKPKSPKNPLKEMSIPQVALARNYCPSTAPSDSGFAQEPQAEEENKKLWAAI